MSGPEPVSLVAGHLSELVERIGPRLVGTDGNDRAVAYAHQVLRDAGFGVGTVAFPAPRWTPRSARLMIDGVPVEADLNPFSPSARGHGPVVPAGTLDTLNRASLRGGVPFLYGELTQGPLARQGSPHFPPALDVQVARRLRDAGALAAVLCSTGASAEPMTGDWELPLPAFTVTPDTARSILRAHTATVEVDARLSIGEAHHLVARRGTGPRVVVMAHVDTKGAAPGALDNASGVAALLTLAQLTRDERWPFTLEFVVFNGEEYGLGEDAYLHATGSCVGDILLALNLDGVGPALGVNTVMTSGLPDTLGEAVDRERQRLGWLSVEPWWNSNHFTFMVRSVPCVAVASTGLAGRMHTPLDTLADVEVFSVADAALFALQLLRQVGARGPAGTPT